MRIHKAFSEPTRDANYTTACNLEVLVVEVIRKLMAFRYMRKKA